MKFKAGNKKKISKERCMLPFLVVFFLLIGWSDLSFAQGRLQLKSILPMSDATWDIWGYYDSISGIEYAVVGANGITMVDISDPENPEIVSNIPNVANFDHKIWKNYVYTVSGSGVDGSFGHIIDIKDPLNPVLVDSFPSAHNLFIDDKGYMYASNPGVIIYDLNNDPTQPDSLWKGGIEGHDVTVVDDVLYDFHGRYGTNIYDVTDRSNPVLLTFIDDPFIEYHHQGWVSKDKKYLYICDELAKGETSDISVWDIQDMDNPERVDGFGDNSATVHNIYIMDDWAFCAYYAAGVRIYDLQNPANPVLTDEFDTTPDLDEEGYEGVFGVYPFTRNNLLLASDRKKGLYIFTFDTVRVTPDPVFKEFEWEIYPTLTHEEVNIDIKRGTEDIETHFTISIHNAIGQLIFYDNFNLKDIYHNSISLLPYKKGLFHVQVKNGDKQIYQRVVKY